MLDDLFFDIDEDEGIGFESDNTGYPYGELQGESQTQTQILDLKAGWNLVSFYVQAEDMTTATVLEPIWDQLEQIKNLNKSYDPGLPSFLNTLTDLNVSDGYWLKVTDAVILDIAGAVLEEVSMSVKKGWNLVGYPAAPGDDGDVSPKDELVSLGNTLVQIKHLTGSYDSSLPPFLNTLSTMTAGLGYWLNVSKDGTWAVGAGSTVDDPSLVSINEFVAANQGSLLDDVGETPDWIELFNPSNNPVSLAGWSISDDSEDPMMHVFNADLSIPAGGWLLLYADGDPTLSSQHLEFRLSNAGEWIGLYREGELVDDVEFGPGRSDWSFARIMDGVDDWQIDTTPSPGKASVGTVVPLAPSTQRCDPRATLESEDALEGDVVTVTIACSDGVSIQDFELVAVTADRGKGGDVDAETGVWTWATGLVDGGQYDMLFVIKPRDATGMPETVPVTFWVADDWQHPSNVPVDPQTYTEEWDVPVMYLYPESRLTQSYVETEVIFRGEVYAAEMKIRGAASTSYPQNSFTLKFDPVNIALRDDGLQRKDHLVLITSFDDNSCVRQKLVYDVWNDIANWFGEERLTPRTFFTVVYLDGEYQGLYTAIDHIDSEFIDEMGLAGSTGNLYKSISHAADYRTLGHSGWEFKEGFRADFDDLEALNRFVAFADQDTFLAEHDEWIDRHEFMDWFLLVFHLLANDSGGKNAYLFNDPANPGFRFVPWDMNESLGQSWTTSRLPASDYNDFKWRNKIFEFFQEEPILARRALGSLRITAAVGCSIESE